MFENLNPLDRSTAWLEIFLLMLGAFLIGYLIARRYYLRDNRKKIDALEKEKNKYKTLSMENPNARHNEGLRVVKTRERAGKLAFEPEPELIVREDLPTELNFDSFGKASEADKDDLNKDIEDVTNLIEFFPGRIERDNWRKQAKDLMD